MEDIIRIEHLSKSFGEVKAVQDLSFRVKEGELFAFLGINGAGKSTTINIMCGQLGKDGGSVETWIITSIISNGSWAWCFKTLCWMRR